MVDWKKLIRPIQESKVLTQILVKSPPVPEPSQDEFVSPLQAAVKEELHIKEAIGYNSTCVNCSRQSGVDKRLAERCAEAADPEPWLKELHTELVSTREDLKDYHAENRILRDELAAVRGDVNPIKRMLYLFGAGLAGLGAKAAWDLYLQNFILGYLPQGLLFVGRLIGII